MAPLPASGPCTPLPSSTALALVLVLSSQQPGQKAEVSTKVSSSRVDRAGVKCLKCLKCEDALASGYGAGPAFVWPSCEVLGARSMQCKREEVDHRLNLFARWEYTPVVDQNAETRLLARPGKDCLLSLSYTESTKLICNLLSRSSNLEI